MLKLTLFLLLQECFYLAPVFVLTLFLTFCRCPPLEATPSSFFHNSQLPPPTEVSLSILELGRGELLLAYYFNLMAPSFYG
jgi:hypothetical protein